MIQMQSGSIPFNHEGCVCVHPYTGDTPVWRVGGRSIER